MSIYRRWSNPQKQGMTMSDSPPTKGPALPLPERWKAHARFERLLFRAIARLGRQGFLVPPSESVELIYDFFLEEWEKVVDGYNAQKGGPEGYIYRAFLYFARRRIVTLQRWTKCLANASWLEQVADDAAAPAAEAEAPAAADRDKWQEAFRRGVAELPPREADVLRSYLEPARLSERRLCDRFQVTRYRLRELLTDALGRLVTLLGERGRLSALDWPIALALWREGRTVRQTAAHLRREVSQVQQVRRRIARLLQEGLELKRSGSRDESKLRPISQASEVSKMPVDRLELFRRALGAVNDRAILEEVRSHAPEILDQLRRTDLRWDERLQAIVTENPEWISEVYDALGDSGELPAQDQDTLEAMLRAGREDQAEVEHAFDLANDAASAEGLNLLLR
jgi:hypothetical protein